MLFLIVYTINHPIFPSVCEWTYKLWYHHAVEHERVRRRGVPFSNMDKSQKLPNHGHSTWKEYMFWDSMHLKFKIKQNQPVAGEIRMMGLSLVKMILAQCERCFWHFSLFNFYRSFRNMFLLWEFINCTLKICVLFYMCISRSMKWQNLTKAGNTSWTFKWLPPKATYFLKINMHTHTHTYTNHSCISQFITIDCKNN